VGKVAKSFWGQNAEVRGFISVNRQKGNVIKLNAAGRVAQRIETKTLACIRSKFLKSRSLGLDTALWAYSTSARSLNLMTLGRKEM